MTDALPRLLIVDDEKMNIDILVDLLRGDYRTIVAKEGEQALKRAGSDPKPDLILLDIMMPGIDGFEVCRRLKANEATREIPVIFVTGKSEVADEAQGFNVGAVDYIHKPISPAIVKARIRTHLSLERQKRSLMELNELKNHFLGMAAHDLRNPLNVIRGLSEVLLIMDVSAEEKVEFLQTINQGSEHMLTLINDLLDISVIESGRLDLNIAPGDLGDLIGERVSFFQHKAKEKNIRIETRFEEIADVRFDRARLAQVVDNLITNAIKFSPPDTTIQVRTAREGGGAFFLVKDQGPGLSEADQAKLFGAFQRLTAQPTGGEESTGLGLSIVKKIVDAHGGRVKVESALGGGSEFKVELVG